MKGGDLRDREGPAAGGEAGDEGRVGGSETGASSLGLCLGIVDEETAVSGRLFVESRGGRSEVVLPVATIGESDTKGVRARLRAIPAFTYVRILS